MYSNGLSEVILGKAIKEHNLPRDEIVVITKVGWPVNRDPQGEHLTPLPDAELMRMRYANQKGLSRKVRMPRHLRSPY